MERLRELTTKVMEIRDQINQPTNPKTQPPASTHSSSHKGAMGAFTRLVWRGFWIMLFISMTMCLVCNQQPQFCSTEQSRIDYLIGLLRGNALAWATAMWEKQSPALTTYTASTDEMRRVFDHPVYGQDASKRLLSLRQGMRSVADYWHNESLQAVFSQGLNETIKDELVSHPEPFDFEDLVSLVIRIDNRLCERRREAAAPTYCIPGTVSIGSSCQCTPRWGRYSPRLAKEGALTWAHATRAFPSWARGATGPL